jgi:hypothetical protein
LVGFRFSAYGSELLQHVSEGTGGDRIPNQKCPEIQGAGLVRAQGGAAAGAEPAELDGIGDTRWGREGMPVGLGIGWGGSHLPQTGMHNAITGDAITARPQEAQGDRVSA